MTEEYYRSLPDTITIREVKIGGKIIVTTFLSDKDISKNDLKELYRNRWHVELDFRNIKTTLGMEVLSCKTPDMAAKEIWVYFLAHNLIRIIMAEAASLADLLPRQLSFKHSLQLWQAYRQCSLDTSDHDGMMALLHMIEENLVGNRPGRIEPRAVKRRPKPYPFLKQRREKVREMIRKFGHPEKQKIGMAA